MSKSLKPVLLGVGVGCLAGFMVGTALLGPVAGLGGAAVGLVLGGGFGVALALSGGFSDRWPRWVRHVEFDCPHSHHNVKATVLENSDTHQIVEVESCSTFNPPHAIRCKKGCMDDINCGHVSPVVIS